MKREKKKESFFFIVSCKPKYKTQGDNSSKKGSKMSTAEHQFSLDGKKLIKHFENIYEMFIKKINI